MTVPIKGRGSLEKTNFGILFSLLGGCGGQEKTDLEPFFLWKCVVVSKGLILDDFYFRICGSLERMRCEPLSFRVGVVVLNGLL